MLERVVEGAEVFRKSWEFFEGWLVVVTSWLFVETKLLFEEHLNLLKMFL
jgi:hypothetical protein